MRTLALLQKLFNVNHTTAVWKNGLKISSGLMIAQFTVRLSYVHVNVG